MAVISTLISSIASLFPPGQNSYPTGADAVRTAVSEIEGLKNKDFTATLGEPDIVQESGHYFNEPKVVVPIYDVPYSASDRLVFDLPEGRDDGMSQFNQLLDIFDVSFENMEDIEGDTVPVEFYGGNATIDWNKVSDKPDKGGKGNEWEKEEIEHVVEEDGESDEKGGKSNPDPESNPTDTQSETTDDYSDFTVKETTISADTEGDDA